MKQTTKIMVLTAFIWLYNSLNAFGQSKPDLQSFNHLLVRIVPHHRNAFAFELIPTQQGHDVFELDFKNGKVILRGNNSNALSVALNYYLKYYCNTSVSWYADDPVELPAILPPVTKKVRKEVRCKYRFFFNYCTFGYTMPWWQWKDWERCIDWMALNGINMPLATTGQEAVWYQVWRSMGLSDRSIRNYFTGPPYLPWHRMSNIDKWKGPLPKSWLKNQVALQKKILARERSLNMTPVLPAFAGHVPEALREKFPNAKITRLSEWGGFSDAYCTYFLDPFDPLFTCIQQKFLSEQQRMFGTNHIYGTDPFNEVAPPSLTNAYLAKVSKAIYETISKNDSSALWLQMTWLFYIDRNLWTNERIQAYLTAVPQNKMLLLDYYCENKEVWKLTHSFFGQPFIWCYLGNFGGNTMLAGNLREVESRLENAFLQSGSNLWGIGSTLEGFDVNPLMYEYVFEKAWTSEKTDVDAWMSKWADRRYGGHGDSATLAWQILLDNIYTSPAQLGQGTLVDARPSLTGSGNWTTTPKIEYDNKDLFRAWQLLLSHRVYQASYEYDVVNIGRQVLGNYFLTLRDSFSVAYATKNKTALRQYGDRMLSVADDIDRLLSTNRQFLLGKWINSAKRLGTTTAEKKYYNNNARTILTTWGTKAGSLNDYANRTWAGLVNTYYRKRWEYFIRDVIAAVQINSEFDEKEFYKKITQFELAWTKGDEPFAETPQGNSFTTAKHLMKKYENGISPKF